MIEKIEVQWSVISDSAMIMIMIEDQATKLREPWEF